MNNLLAGWALSFPIRCTKSTVLAIAVRAAATQRLISIVCGTLSKPVTLTVHSHAWVARHVWVSTVKEANITLGIVCG